MRFLLLGLIALASSLSYGKITSDQEYILNHSGYAAQSTQLGTLIDKNVNMLVAKYSYAIQGGSTTAPIYLLRNLTDSTSYAVLPNNAIIRHVYVDVLTQPTSGGLPIVAVRANSTADLFPATAIASMTTGRLAGAVQGATVTSYFKLSADKKVVVELTKSGGGSVSPLTAGKFNVIIEYTVSD